MTRLSQHLVVRARPTADVVYYDVMSGSGADAALLRSCRYSELVQFHTALTTEMHSFQGKLPRKTMRRRMEPRFVEARRVDIELYLKVAAMSAVDTTVFKNFFSEAFEKESAASTDSPAEPTSRPSASSSSDVPCPSDDHSTLPASSASPGPSASASASALLTAPRRSDAALNEDVGESEDERELSDRSFNEEVHSSLLHKKGQLKRVSTTRIDLETSLASKEDAVMAAEHQARSTAATEAEAAARLHTHRFSLERLEAELAARRAARRNKEAEQLTAAKRLEEELAAASQAAESSRQRYQKARRARLEAEAAMQSHSESLSHNSSAAEASRAAAAEQQAMVTAALTVMKERVRSLAAAAAASERELQSKDQAREMLEQEVTGADSAKSAAQDLASASSTAVAALAEDAARRRRAHEAEVRRATERLEVAVALRDMRSRSLLSGEDRAVVEEAETNARKAVSVAQTAVSMVTQRSEETKKADEAKAAELSAVAEKADTDLKRRESIAGVLRARLMEARATSKAEASRHAATVAAAKAASAEFETVKRRLEVQLSQEVADSDIKVSSSKAAQETAQKKNDAELVSLRHAEEAELMVLRRHEDMEACLVQALDEARTSAAEAHDDIEDSAETQVREEIDLLVMSSKARLADRQRLAQEAATAVETTNRDLDHARYQLEESQRSYEDGVWSVDFTHDLGEDPRAFEGEAILLDGFDSVREAIEALNSDDDRVPTAVFEQGWCVVFHEGQRTNYLIFRSDRRREVEQLFNFLTWMASWAPEQIHDLGSSSSSFVGKAVMLDCFGSVNEAVEALRAGDGRIQAEVFDQGWCIVLLQGHKTHYLLYRADKRVEAEETFNFVSEEPADPFSDDQRAQRVVGLEARVTELERLAHARLVELDAATAAEHAANEELSAMQARQATTPLPTSVLEKLVRREREQVDSTFERRKAAEASALREAEQQVAAWAEEQEALRANLHRASLQCAAAEEDIAAARKLKRSLRVS